MEIKSIAMRVIIDKMNSVRLLARALHKLYNFQTWMTQFRSSLADIYNNTEMVSSWKLKRSSLESLLQSSVFLEHLRSGGLTERVAKFCNFELWNLLLQSVLCTTCGDLNSTGFGIIINPWFQGAECIAVAIACFQASLQFFVVFLWLINKLVLKLNSAVNYTQSFVAVVTVLLDVVVYWLFWS